jgi:hypothetical protein
MHCAFSHGDHDLRKPIVLKQGMPHKLVEPSIPLLQEQQKLMAALTGLSIAELNGFSLSGQNNSMAFGGGSSSNSTNTTGSSSTNTTGGTQSALAMWDQTPPPQQQQQQQQLQQSSQGKSQAYSPSQPSHPLLHASDVGLHGDPGSAVAQAQFEHARNYALNMQQQARGSNLSPSQNQAATFSFQPQQSQSPALVSSGNGPQVSPTGSYRQLGATSTSGSSTPGSGDVPFAPVAPVSPSNGQMINLDPSFLASLEPNKYICPPEERAQDREFYLYSYKTQPCRSQSLACTKGECPNYHYENKRRRNPRLYRYSSEPCPAVKQSPSSDGSSAGGWKRPSSCRMGDACGYSHTLLESMYHPSVFKTVLCSNFDEKDRASWQRCPWKRACAHAHSRSEMEYAEGCLRREAGLPTSGSEIPPNHAGAIPDPSWGYNMNPVVSAAVDRPSSRSPSFLTGGASGDNSLSSSPKLGFRRGLKPPPGSNSAPTSGLSRAGTGLLVGHPDSVSHSLSDSCAEDNGAIPPGPSPRELATLDHAQLVDRVARYEKEAYLHQLRILEKESQIKQLQWCLEMEREEAAKLRAQLEAAVKHGGAPPPPTQTNPPMPPPQQQPQQQQANSHVQPNVSHPPVSNIVLPSTSHSVVPLHVDGDLALYKGDSAATAMAESVLISPIDEGLTPVPRHHSKELSMQLAYAETGAKKEEDNNQNGNGNIGESGRRS